MTRIKARMLASSASADVPTSRFEFSTFLLSSVFHERLPALNSEAKILEAEFGLMLGSFTQTVDPAYRASVQ